MIEQEQLKILQSWVTFCNGKLKSLMLAYAQGDEPKRYSKKAQDVIKFIKNNSNYYCDKNWCRNFAQLLLDEELPPLNETKKIAPLPFTGCMIVFDEITQNATRYNKYPVGRPILMDTNASGMSLNGAYGFGNFNVNNNGVRWRLADEGEIEKLIHSISSLMVEPLALKSLLAMAQGWDRARQK